jgi:NAD(P)-dependent dehydrogenase (short-subunit alcohol dehydrogenase family)
VIGINLRGVWSCMKHELQQMQRQGGGAIVNNASVGALTGNPGIGAYIASKHGVVGLTRTAALEYIKHGIRVNAVNPGTIDTQIARDVVGGEDRAFVELEMGAPIGRAGRPEEIASAVLWLCSSGRVDGAVMVAVSTAVAYRSLAPCPIRCAWMPTATFMWRCTGMAESCGSTDRHTNRTSAAAGM